MTHEHPGDLDALYEKSDLSLNGDTRPRKRPVEVVCACGEEQGALYYACSHNHSPVNNTPIIIEFKTESSAVAIDGKDFLYPVFQWGDPSRARPEIAQIYGKAILRYADKAWANADQSFRVAQCDLAIHDQNVIEAHYANQIILGGRHRTTFRSAFTAALPVKAESIVRVWSPSGVQTLPQPMVKLEDVRQIAQ